MKISVKSEKHPSGFQRFSSWKQSTADVLCSISHFHLQFWRCYKAMIYRYTPVWVAPCAGGTEQHLCWGWGWCSVVKVPAIVFLPLSHSPASPRSHITLLLLYSHTQYRNFNHHTTRYNNKTALCIYWFLRLLDTLLTSIWYYCHLLIQCNEMISYVVVK